HILGKPINYGVKRRQCIGIPCFEMEKPSPRYRDRWIVNRNAGSQIEAASCKLILIPNDRTISDVGQAFNQISWPARLQLPFNESRQAIFRPTQLSPLQTRFYPVHLTLHSFQLVHSWT